MSSATGRRSSDLRRWRRSACSRTDTTDTKYLQSYMLLVMCATVAFRSKVKGKGQVVTDKKCVMTYK